MHQDLLDPAAQNDLTTRPQVLRGITSIFSECAAAHAALVETDEVFTKAEEQLLRGAGKKSGINQDTLKNRMLQRRSVFSDLAEVCGETLSMAAALRELEQVCVAVCCSVLQCIYRLACARTATFYRIELVWQGAVCCRVSQVCVAECFSSDMCANCDFVLQSRAVLLGHTQQIDAFYLSRMNAMEESWRVLLNCRHDAQHHGALQRQVQQQLIQCGVRLEQLRANAVEQRGLSANAAATARYIYICIHMYVCI